MPPKPPPPPPNVSTPRRRHRGAASSRSKSAAKELSSPHHPLRPSRKRSTRRHHRRHKADDVVRVSRAATPPHQTAGDTSPATRPLPPFAKAADPDRRLRTSPNGAITGATNQEAHKPRSTPTSSLVIVIPLGSPAPRVRRPRRSVARRLAAAAAPSPRAGRRLKCSKRHSSRHGSGELKWTSLVKEPRVEEASPR